jgi:26S proteasome regulatory subunit N1
MLNRQEIRSATSSMTSVPKPLKFLRPHYGTLKAYFETMPESDLKKYMADILSVLALTMSAEGERVCEKYHSDVFSLCQFPSAFLICLHANF